jgi:hypothetical protein
MNTPMVVLVSVGFAFFLGGWVPAVVLMVLFAAIGVAFRRRDVS